MLLYYISLRLNSRAPVPDHSIKQICPDAPCIISYSRGISCGKCNASIPYMKRLADLVSMKVHFIARWLTTMLTGFSETNFIKLERKVPPPKMLPTFVPPNLHTFEEGGKFSKLNFSGFPASPLFNHSPCFTYQGVGMVIKPIAGPLFQIKMFMGY